MEPAWIGDWRAEVDPGPTFLIGPGNGRNAPQAGIWQHEILAANVGQMLTRTLRYLGRAYLSATVTSQ